VRDESISKDIDKYIRRDIFPHCSRRYIRPMDASFQERRKAPRFQGRLDVELDKGTGVTRDFSTSGVYFETDRSFSPADPIEFFMNLEHTDLVPQACVRCRGEVVRVELMDEKTGVAVAIHSFRLKVAQEPGQG
jgi:hypothetical protein